MNNTNKDLMGTSGDAKIMAAYWGAERVWDFIQSEFGRRSYDGQGSLIRITGIRDTNAHWSSGQASFGFRDDINFSSLQIVAHQITHGIIESTANLVYQDEPGAINESIADIFGQYCFQKILNRPTAWQIGTQTTHFGRSFPNPKQFSHPDTYKGDNWYQGTLDFGGVHTNSGPLNHAFYLLCEGGIGTNDVGGSYEVSGIGIDEAIRIVYRALTNYLTQNSQYADVRPALNQAAIDLHGQNSAQQINTVEAMWAIGVGDDPNPSTPSAASYLTHLGFGLIMVLLLLL